MSTLVCWHVCLRKPRKSEGYKLVQYICLWDNADVTGDMTGVMMCFASLICRAAGVDGVRWYGVRLVTHLPEVLDDPFSPRRFKELLAAPSIAILPRCACRGDPAEKNECATPPTHLVPRASTPLPPSCGLQAPSRRWRRCSYR
jgi:hypothetical protein